MIERSVEIDPAYNNYNGTIVLAGYHARTAMAEMDQAKQLFDQLLEKTQHKSLMVLFQYAAALIAFVLLVYCVWRHRRRACSATAAAPLW